MNGLIERVRLQKAVLEATADDRAEFETTLRNLADAVPNLIALRGATMELSYAQLPDYLRSVAENAAPLGIEAELQGLRMHLVGACGEECQRVRARRLLALTGVRPGRRIAVVGQGYDRLAAALAVLNAGCLATDAQSADIVLTDRAPESTQYPHAIVLVFGQTVAVVGDDVHTRSHPVWFIESLDSNFDLFATTVGDASARADSIRQVRLAEFDVVDASLQSVAPGQVGALRLAGCEEPSGIIACVDPWGRVTIVARWRGDVEIDGDCHVLDALRARFATVVGVRELVMVARSDSQGRTQLVGYFSVIVDAAVDEVRARLDAMVAKISITRVAWSHWPHLPRSLDGDIDVAQLLEMPVLDSEELATAATALCSEIAGTVVHLEVRHRASQHWPVVGVVPPAPSVRAAETAPVDVERDAQLSGEALTVPSAGTLCDLLEHAASQAVTVGVHCIDTLEQTYWSYPELLRRARCKAELLRATGRGKGHRIILHLQRGRELLEWFWGCVLVGAVPCVGTQQGSLADADELVRIGEFVERLSADLIVSESGADTVSRIGTADVWAATVDVDVDIIDGTPSAVMDSDDIALILCTSGSTRRPKLVQQSHRALISQGLASGVGLGLHRDDVSLNWMPLDHVGALVMFHLRDIQLQCQQIHVEKEFILAEPLRWLELIDRYRVSVTWAISGVTLTPPARASMAESVRVERSIG